MKRFTDTAKWDDPWFRGLQGAHKLIFLYVIDRCNNAGFWEVDEDALIFHTKLDKKHLEGAWKALERGLIGASGWTWVRRFLRHQKNELLNSENPAHKQIISLLHDQVERFGGNSSFQEFIAPYKGLLSPIGIGNGKGQGNGNGTGKKEGVQGEPSFSSSFEEFWQAYPRRIGKQEAWKAWVKNKCDAKLPLILSTIRKLKITPGWTKEAGKFIPHPATWINRGGWDDDPESGERTSRSPLRHEDMPIIIDP